MSATATTNPQEINGSVPFRRCLPLRGTVNMTEKEIREAVKNKDLWQALIDASKFHKVTYVKVKAHNGDKYNERCDVLAKEAARNPELDDVGFVPVHNPPKIKYPYYFRKR